MDDKYIEVLVRAGSRLSGRRQAHSVDYAGSPAYIYLWRQETRASCHIVPVLFWKCTERAGMINGIALEG